jgi:hypothetical protein
MSISKANAIMASLLAGIILSSCSPISFEKQLTDDTSDNPLLIAHPDTDLIGTYFFPIQNGKVTYYQLDLGSNQTSLSFQIQDAQGHHVNNISQQNLIITENGTPVTEYRFASNQQAIQQTADIILAVDVTGSMSSTIESAKLRLLNFIDSTQAQGYRTRMCLVTFGDYTIQRCNRFYNNDPSDPSSQAEVSELKNQIYQLKAISGIQDPGGTDFNENPMRALIDSSLAPWGPNSQRFVILITDDGFLYSPSNQGAVGPLAPFMSEVQEAIQRSQMRVFAVTPSLPGYNSDFSVRENGRRVRYPSIVQMSNGEHFLFADMISGRITLDTVLGRIVSNILTTYHVNYIADEISGLQPQLPISQRRIEIQVVGRPDLKVTIMTKSSNLPNGRGEYQKDWIISNRRIKNESLKVKVNGIEQGSGFETDGVQIRFHRAPPAQAKIEIEYEYLDLKDALGIQPIMLPKDVDLNSISIFINAVKAKKGDVTFVKNLEGHWNLSLLDKSLEQDTFRIREFNGASIQIFKTK